VEARGTCRNAIRGAAVPSASRPPLRAAKTALRAGYTALERVPIMLHHFPRVMAGLVPAIHVLLAEMP
jgi:hypothetical protein